MTTQTRAADRSARLSSPRPPAANEAVADVFVSRFGRLTPREIRILVLVVQDRLSYRRVADALGISRANVANTMQSVRRKLAVPVHMDLESFIERVPSLAALVEDDTSVAVAATRSEERRQQDLLRVTVADLEAVAVRARRRADTLGALPAGKGESEVRQREASTARRLARIAEAAAADARREARHQDIPQPDEALS